MNTQRKYGIDFLRIFSMFMVIILHIMGAGGVLDSAEPFTAQYYICLFLRIGCFCAVNCYALISGFVGVNNKFKVYKIASLWLQVAYYTVLITLGFALFTPLSVYWKKAFLPVISYQYWYFTAYFIMFFFTPFFNKLLNNLKEKELKQLGITIFIFLSIIPTIIQQDIFYTNGGYSFIWLSALYIFGGIINKLDIANKISNFVLYFTSTFSVLASFLFKVFFTKHPNEKIDSSVFMTYISPTILLCAISLLIISAKININKKWAINAIEFLSPLSFSVYLIHTHPYVWENIFKNRFVSYAEFSPIKLIAVVILTALAIFFVCVSIDLIRFYIFKFTKISKHLKNLENKIILKLENKNKKEVNKQV